MSQAPPTFLPLTNQALFEYLYSGKQPEGEEFSFKPSYPLLINFTASWCGPCKRIDWAFLKEEFGDKLSFYKCDVDENKYTPGYCSVRSIPSWAILKGVKQMSGPVQISDTAKVASWIFTELRK
jgi:thiol-disulfide isomerase/thioredoxin